MNELVSVPISPWYTIPAVVGLLALTFVFAPGVLLHLGVLLYPKGHARRREFTAELYGVPYLKRPFWVAGVLVRCLFEATPTRIQWLWARRAARESAALAHLPTSDLAKLVRAHRSVFPDLAAPSPFKRGTRSGRAYRRVQRYHRELERRTEALGR